MCFCRIPCRTQEPEQPMEVSDCLIQSKSLVQQRFKLRIKCAISLTGLFFLKYLKYSILIDQNLSQVYKKFDLYILLSTERTWQKDYKEVCHHNLSWFQNGPVAFSGIHMGCRGSWQMQCLTGKSERKVCHVTYSSQIMFYNSFTLKDEGNSISIIHPINPQVILECSKLRT